MRAIANTPGGAIRGFYTGYFTTVMRELPFAAIQFPLWEKLKVSWAQRCDRPIFAYESALCGSVSGAFAAAVTTPLDVIKTRLMLGVDAKGVQYEGTLSTARRIVSDEGASALMRGVESRVAWIGIGGFVFFYAYEFATRTLTTSWKCN